jgi:hypothetical protein
MPTCMLKQELLHQLHRVSKEKAELQKAELEAVLDCTRDPEVELQIENARKMRKVLLDRLRQHLAEHAC